MVCVIDMQEVKLKEGVKGLSPLHALTLAGTGSWAWSATTWQMYGPTGRTLGTLWMRFLRDLQPAMLVVSSPR